MRLSDYIVLFLIEKGITDVFGYPGGMVTHLMDSFEKYKNNISAHVNYHEQASSFCACGYAQVTNKPGIAYATSGPGATNLITGIANAYFDSIPCIFITGQVNTYESKGVLQVRQKGFQETDIVSIVEPITKYAMQVTKAENIKYELEKAFEIATGDRPGPVILDIPMNIFKAEIDPYDLPSYSKDKQLTNDLEKHKNVLLEALKVAEKPVLLAGHGIASANVIGMFREIVNYVDIPVVTSMTGKEVLETSDIHNFGFVGAYGHRYANFILSNCDLIISIGSRMDCRQTGNNLQIFSPKAKVIRIDTDLGELSYKIKEDQINIEANLKDLLPVLLESEFSMGGKFKSWLEQCKELKRELQDMDEQYETSIIKAFSKITPEDAIITTDVGQNQVWVAQGFDIRGNQRMLFSGGHGAMGYSLPAAIGAYYGQKRKVISFNGDGGFQMNLQELQFIVREQLPIKIVLLNNVSLGMIRHFQEMYFESNFVQTKDEGGYSVPCFRKIIEAYGMNYMSINTIEELQDCKCVLEDEKPWFVEIKLSDTTYVFPKLAIGKPIHDQEPLLDRELFDALSNKCSL